MTTTQSCISNNIIFLTLNAVKNSTAPPPALFPFQLLSLCIESISSQLLKNHVSSTFFLQVYFFGLFCLSTGSHLYYLFFHVGEHAFPLPLISFLCIQHFLPVRFCLYFPLFLHFYLLLHLFSPFRFLFRVNFLTNILFALFQVRISPFLSHHLFPHLLISLIHFGFLFLSKFVLLNLSIDHVFEKILGVDDSLPLVEIFNVLEGLHQLHFPFGIIGLVFEVFHGIALLLVDLQLFEVLFCLLGVLDGLVVPGPSGFDDIIVVFGIGFEGDLGVAVGALKVEPEDLYTEIGLLVADFHPHVELGPDVEVISAGVAPQTHREHVPDHHQLVLAPTAFYYDLVVKVLGEILDYYLPLCHLLYFLFQIISTIPAQKSLGFRKWVGTGRVGGKGGRAGFWARIEQQNQKIQLRMSSKGAVTISHEELIRMKMRANVIPNQGENNLALHQYQQSQKRTDKWVDNPKDLKKRKEEERFRKFEKEELERRKVDQEERRFQLQKKEQQLAVANQKLFQDSEQVRALNSKLLYSDSLQGREQQLEIKKYMQDIEKKREQFYHQQTMNQIRKGEEEERRVKEEEKAKNKKFEKDLKKQHKQVIKQYVNQYKDQMEEGKLLKLKAEAALREEEEKERDRRARNMQNRKDIEVINNNNKDIKAVQAQKEREEQVKIQQYRKKQELRQDVTKKRQQDLINQKIQQREQLYKQQAFKLSQVKNNEIQRLNSQIDELEKKQAEIERKKAEEKKILKHQYQESLKEQVERRKREKEQEQQDNQKFKETWKQKLSTLKDQEDNDDKFRKNLYQKNADDLKRQMEEKQMKRQQKLRQELIADEEAKAALENKDKQFKSYAEKCIKEWDSNGKNLYPIIKHLSATMKS